METRCPPVTALVEWAAGRGSPAQRLLLDQHLKECERCCAVVAKLGAPRKSSSSLNPTVPIRPAAPNARTVERTDGPEPATSPSLPPELAVTAQSDGPPASTGPTIGRSVGRYLLLSELGQGGMGQVYAAYDPELDRKVAIKLLRAEISGVSDLAARLMREAQAMARLSHPNVVSVFDVGTHYGQVFIAMEFMAGRPLSAWLADGNKSWEEVLRVYKEAGKGLVAAHEAGIIHRDFKPDNVLVGNDGAVRVLDFGLARPATDSVPPEARNTLIPNLQGQSGPLDTPLTVDGMFMGTPAYMPPEQFRGAAVDAAADQYSFAVALYEGLYGRRPYSASDVQAAALAKKPLAPPVTPDGRVPTWLKKAMLRALSLDPAERFPSMRALLDALGQDASVVRTRIAVAAGIALFLVGAASTAAIYGNRVAAPPDVCTGAEQKLKGAWDEPTRQSLKSAFAATGKPYADAAWAATEQTLDRYTSSWVVMRTDACRATRVRGEQSEALLDLRIGCLDRWLAEVKSLVDVLARADARAVEEAATAAQSLSPLSRCADAEALKTAARPVPDDAAKREPVEKTRAALLRSRSLADLGRLAEGRTETAKLEAETRALGFAPLTAEVLAQLGELAQRVGDNTAAEPVLYEAGWTALSVKDFDAAARAFTALTVAMIDLGRPDEALRWGSYANAAIAALGGNPILQARLHHVLGIAYEAKGDRAAAMAHLEKCLTLREQEYGEGSLQVAATRSAFGTELHKGGKLEDAVAHHQKAVEAKKAMLGEGHPAIVPAWQGLANAFTAQGKHEAAIALHQRTVSLLEFAYGKEDQRTATALGQLAAAELAAGKADTALKIQTDALARTLTAVGKTHPDAAVAYARLGDLLAQKGDRDGAINAMRSALAASEASFGADSVRSAPYLTRLGEELLELKKSGEASELLERAVNLCAENTPGSIWLPRAHFALAQALLSTGEDQERALQLAELAKQGFTTAEGSKDQAAKVEAWLARAARKKRSTR